MRVKGIKNSADVFFGRAMDMLVDKPVLISSA